MQSYQEVLYRTEASPSLISLVTDAVADEVKAWPSRPLEPVYPIVYLDCLQVKVRAKVFYLAIGYHAWNEQCPDGDRYWAIVSFKALQTNAAGILGAVFRRVSARRHNARDWSRL